LISGVNMSGSFVLSVQNDAIYTNPIAINDPDMQGTVANELFKAYASIPTLQRETGADAAVQVDVTWLQSGNVLKLSVQFPTRIVGCVANQISYIRVYQSSLIGELFVMFHLITFIGSVLSSVSLFNVPTSIFQ
jgi:hypothetical protein